MVSFLKKLFSAPPTPELNYVTARLTAKSQPLDRGEYFADPLDEVLQAEGLGEVTGGGTQLADEPYGIEFCDLEIGLVSLDDATLEKVVACLEACGAPKGSQILFEDAAQRAPISFGQNDGLSLALNGTDLPEEVYAESDVNERIDTLSKALDGVGAMKGFWEGSRYTMLYFYGPSFTAMEKTIRPIIDTRPDTQLSEITQIA